MSWFIKYPGMTRQEREKWQTFFSLVRQYRWLSKTKACNERGAEWITRVLGDVKRKRPDVVRYATQRYGLDQLTDVEG